jgi:ferredoxin-NADP reductase
MSEAPTWIRAHVAEVLQETPIDRTLVFALPAAARKALTWRPGQHLVVRLPDETPPRTRPYSLSGASGPDRPVRITVRDGGAWGRPVYERAAGSPVDLAGPGGSFDLGVPPGHDAVLVAGGSGIAPFRAFVEAWREDGAPGRVALLHAVKAREHLLFHDEMTTTAREVAGFSYVPTLTAADDAHPWSGARGRVGAAHLAAQVRDAQRTIVCACGPAALVDDALAWAADLGVPQTQRRREVW